MVSAREVARRRLDSERLLRTAAASRQALTGHMNRAARRDTGWIKGALELKRDVERDHGDLARSLKTLDELLSGLHDVQKQLAPFVDAQLMLPDAQRDLARAVVQAEAPHDLDGVVVAVPDREAALAETLRYRLRRDGLVRDRERRHAAVHRRDAVQLPRGR